MALLDFPIEILQRIIKDTIPESIENVVTTCSTLYNAGKIYLEEHNRLRKRYRHFTFSRYTKKLSRVSRPVNTNRRWDRVTAETSIEVTGANELLQEIIRNPLIPRYIVTADLKENVGLTYYPEDVEYQDPKRRKQQFFPRIKDEETDGLRSLLRDSPYLLEAGADPENWLQGILGDTSGHAEVFLLTLLNNVRELAPPNGWDELFLRKSSFLRYREGVPRSDRTVIWPVLDAIVRRANDPSTPDAGLSKLEILRPFAGTGYECRKSMTHNVPFLAIRSLREAYIGGCIALNDGYTGKPFEPEYPEYSPLLEKLELVGCTFGPSEMRSLLSRVPNLKCLRFAYETKWHGCGHNIDVGDVLNIIMECTGETLEELSAWMITHYGATGRTLVDMTGFKRLKYLHIDGIMLMGPKFEKDDEDYDIDCAPETCPVDQMAAPRMVDCLPPSIGVLHLQIDQAVDRIEKPPAQIKRLLEGLYDGFSEEREKKLPNLREVVVEVFENTVEANLREELQAHGAKVVVRPEGDLAEPKFMMEFYTRFGVTRG